MSSRVRRTFWTLVVVSVLAAGALSRALAAPSGPGSGLTVAAAGLVLTASSLLALRILIVVERKAIVESTPSRSRKPKRVRRPG